MAGYLRVIYGETVVPFKFEAQGPVMDATTPFTWPPASGGDFAAGDLILSLADFDSLFGPALQADKALAPAEAEARGPAAEAARLARQVRQEKRREKPVPPAPLAASSSVTARLEALERDARSTSLRLAFLAKENSKLQAQVETLSTKNAGLEARNAVLEADNTRLRSWLVREPFQDSGAGI
jgi:hypothetical protein